MAVSDYDTTPGNNTTISEINIAEGCSPDGINDAIRQMMADIASWDADIPKMSDTETISGAWTFSATATFGVVDLTGKLTLNPDSLIVMEARGRAIDDKSEIRFYNNADTEYGAFRYDVVDDEFRFYHTENTDLAAIIAAGGTTMPDAETVATREKGDARWPNIESGAGAPSSTPGKVGDKYLDTTNKVKYVAYGTSSSADWEAVQKPLGQGQTWQDVSGSRSANTTYQNTTGQTIAVAVDWSNSNSSDKGQVSTDGVSWVDVAWGSAGARIDGGFVVPDQHYYRVTASVDAWAELR